MSRVLHTFYDVNMCIAHRGMAELLADHKIDALKTGEVAVFVNKKMTAAKILHPNGHLHYWRCPNNVPLSVDMLRGLPMRLPRTPLNFGTALSGVLAHFEKRFEIGKDGRKAARKARRA